ncbi:NEDD8-activating enzyme E1 regulatory subunit-like [Phodopus roborovskii]|uniref:NEDD8-activating enzyme E1 regulatory subunit-like n=1 Tax=Phodopus roborovskii TaxID=109678 RepID=UPI0021E42E2E|nr:NEDD8-activating enzyme E1 regulatory subunit-like [Phodopus roborovskii]
MAQQGKLLKEQKYDRQLRLWGDHGQEALESAHVCLINATATGTEILKNLVLPGIGSFTIIDGKQVSGEDAGNKYVLFFYHMNLLEGSALRMSLSAN